MDIAFAKIPVLSAIIGRVLGLLAILFIPEERRALIKGISALFSGIALVPSITVFFTYDKSQGGIQFVEKLPWFVRWFGQWPEARRSRDNRT